MEGFDVCIIGGGITGCGIARDLALRGLSVVLLEKGDLGVGTTGRSHGLVHSGGRYVVSDPESAQQCARENEILRRIAGSFIQPTNGLFVDFGDDGYAEQFEKGCKKVGVWYEELSREETLKLEPALNENIERAYEVKDAVCDPFLLTVANAKAAHENGAEIRTHAEVLSIRDGVVTYRKAGKKGSLKAEVVVNACGVWAGEVAKRAGRKLSVKPYKGTILIYLGRATSRVINHLRYPQQGDIILPHRSTTLVGTTMREESRLERFGIDGEEIDFLHSQGVQKIPKLAKMKLLRAYAGLRPIVGEAHTRGFSVIEDEGFITVTGGKFTTYRLMAEQVSDRVCRLLGVRAKCTTAKEEILEEPADIKSHKLYWKYGALAKYLPREMGERVCLCENVSRGEVLFAVEHLFASNIRDIRRRTRLGMGACQGRRCSFATALVLYDSGFISVEEAHKQTVNSLRERWKGMLPLKMHGEMAKIYAQYACSANYNVLKKELRGLEKFL